MVSELNARDLALELEWFENVLQLRSQINAGVAGPGVTVFDIAPPDITASNSAYAEFVRTCSLNFEERFLLVLSMAPHIKPQALDVFLVQNTATGQIFTEFGGRKGKIFNGFLPTAETFLFMLASNDLATRFRLMKLFDASHVFWSQNVLETDSLDPAEPRTSIPLSLSLPFLELFTTGDQSLPRFSQEFPAQLLRTAMDWSDLILPPDTFEKLGSIYTWLTHYNTLMNDWGMARKLKPGYKALFYGPPGTGKSLAATLLGKQMRRDVFRIDLSKIISKYIGETGKNLARVFDRAENRGWILFFDEADSLFGKRTQISDSHDRYANQETSFLLQRIEEYNGLVILATNFRHNLDDAFVRRFQSIIEFPIPGAEERHALWKNGFSERAVLEDKLDLRELAQKFEIPGGLIMNVIQHSSLQALRRGTVTIRRSDVYEGVKIELMKSGRTL